MKRVFLQLFKIQFLTKFNRCQTATNYSHTKIENSFPITVSCGSRWKEGTSKLLEFKLWVSNHVNERSLMVVHDNIVTYYSIVTDTKEVTVPITKIVQAVIFYNKLYSYYCNSVTKNFWVRSRWATNLKFGCPGDQTYGEKLKNIENKVGWI